MKKEKRREEKKEKKTKQTTGVLKNVMLVDRKGKERLQLPEEHRNTIRAEEEQIRVARTKQHEDYYCCCDARTKSTRRRGRRYRHEAYIIRPVGREVREQTRGNKIK